MKKISVLFAREDSIYKTLPGVDVWDWKRDARAWPGGNPCICHPPCRAWGKLKYFAKPEEGEKELALLAVRFTRMNGGIVEHPYHSSLRKAASLPSPGCYDKYGGYLLTLPQFWFGHLAQKASFFYIVGIKPEIPFKMGAAEFGVSWSSKSKMRGIPKAMREETPRDLALWLVKTARLIEV